MGTGETLLVVGGRRQCCCSCCRVGEVTEDLGLAEVPSGGSGLGICLGIGRFAVTFGDQSIG